MNSKFFLVNTENVALTNHLNINKLVITYTLLKILVSWQWSINRFKREWSLNPIKFFFLWTLENSKIESQHEFSSLNHKSPSSQKCTSTIPTFNVLLILSLTHTCTHMNTCVKPLKYKFDVTFFILMDPSTVKRYLQVPVYKLSRFKYGDPSFIYEWHGKLFPCLYMARQTYFRTHSR